MMIPQRMVASVFPKRIVTFLATKHSEDLEFADKPATWVAVRGACRDRAGKSLVRGSDFRRSKNEVYPSGGKAGHGGSGDGDLHEAGFHGERHPLLGANFQTAENGLVDVCRRLVLSFALADATGNGRALGDPNSVLIAVQCDAKFHGNKLASSGWFGQFFDGIVDGDQMAGVVPAAGSPP